MTTTDIAAVRGYLTELLSIHWLRPETALWRAFDCLLMHERPLAGEAVDLGCGDGTLSYIMAGGRVCGLDAYADVAGLGAFNEGRDIYEAQANGQASLDLDTSALRYRFACGVDHKDGLLSKARRLGGFYRVTRQADLNQPAPFAPGSFDSAFSNVFYWLDEPAPVLRDWHGLLREGGRLVLFVPNATFKDKAWFYYRAPHAGDRHYYNHFDRGYAALIKHCLGAGDWERLFAQAGFGVSRHVRYLTDPVMEIWNVGTRPISPLLIDMANKLSPADRAAARRQWVDYFLGFLEPIVLGELDRRPDESGHAFHLYELEKR
jgi:SAM-dependent methyltransferase